MACLALKKGVYSQAVMNDRNVASMTLSRTLHNILSVLARLTPLALVFLLAGCTGSNHKWSWILNPNGPIATQSVRFLAIDIGLLLIIIVPTTALTLWAIYRYRNRGGGTYDPSFNHSILIEVFAWGVPIIVVGALSYYSVLGAKAVDPAHPASVKKQAAASSDAPLDVDVITTDWQWLFIYPKQNVAISNKLVLPVNRTIKLNMTSASITNDFYIQQLVGQEYIMPGMETHREFLLKRPGVYDGYSMELSGPGFSWMHYKAHIVSKAHFKQWVASAQSGHKQLNYEQFKQFAKPTINTGNVSQTFSNVGPKLFLKVVHHVRNGKLKHNRPMRLSDDMNSQIFQHHTN